MKKKEIKYNRSMSWNLDIELIGFLKKGLEYYLEDAPKYIDLDVYKNKWQGEEMTQGELIRLLKEKVDTVYDDYCHFEYDENLPIEIINDQIREVLEEVDDMFDLLKLVFVYLNW